MAERDVYQESQKLRSADPRLFVVADALDNLLSYGTPHWESWFGS
jgi:hypothetical protein